MDRSEAKQASTSSTRRTKCREAVWVKLPLVVVVGTLVWLFVGRPVESTTRATGGLTRLEPPLELPDFELIRDDGLPLVRETLEGHWTLLSIGFMSCPDICPNTLGILSSAIGRADPQGRDVQALFVSVDPERDRPERLRAYVGHFGEHVIGATGSHARLRDLTRPLGLSYAVPANEPIGSSYGVEHSTTVVVIDPESRAVGLIGSHHRSVETVVAALAALREDSR